MPKTSFRHAAGIAPTSTGRNISSAMRIVTAHAVRRISAPSLLDSTPKTARCKAVAATGRSVAGVPALSGHRRAGYRS
jgi:hypothetical protein